MTLRPKMRRRRRTKIIATLGPASSTPEVLTRLFQGGADVFRLNFSHGTHDDHAERIAMIRDLGTSLDRPIGILADVQGPKLRVGTFAGGRVQLQTGNTFLLDLQPDAGRRPPRQPAASRDHPGRVDRHHAAARRRQAAAARHPRPRGPPGNRDHGRRPLSDRKGVNVPDMVLPIPALTVKDREDLAFALEHGVEYIGLSFVQRAEDVAEAREIAAGRAWIMTKVEKPQALDNLDAILALSDAVMVARGDLGVELPPEEVPLAQKRIVRAARLLGKPVVVATQMLESMITSPSPTRAEASDVATAVFDGADAVMLSAETAAGQYPYEAVNMMDRIVARVEQDPGWREIIEASRPAPEHSSADAIAAAARQVAHTVGAAAICAFTAGGGTALRAARERPEAPILGMTPSRQTAQRLAVVWGVHATVTAEVHSMSETVAKATRAALQEGFAQHGDEIVVIAGVPFGQPGTTNALRVAHIK